MPNLNKCNKIITIIKPPAIKAPNQKYQGTKNKATAANSNTPTKYLPHGSIPRLANIVETMRPHINFMTAVLSKISAAAILRINTIISIITNQQLKTSIYQYTKKTPML